MKKGLLRLSMPSQLSPRRDRKLRSISSAPTHLPQHSAVLPGPLGQSVVRGTDPRGAIAHRRPRDRQLPRGSDSRQGVFSRACPSTQVASARSEEMMRHRWFTHQLQPEQTTCP